MSSLLLRAPTPQVVTPIVATYRVQASADDGFTHAAGTGISSALNYLVANHISNTLYNYQSFFLLTPQGQGVPQGKTIQNAKLILTQSSARSASFDTRFAVELADNPTAPTTKPDLQNRTRGTWLVWNTGAPWVVGQVVEVNVTSIVQPVINRSGFGPSSRIMFFWEYATAQNGTNVPNDNHQVYSFDQDPNVAPRLEITYMP